MDRHAELKDALSFSIPGARFSPAHKIWLQEKAAGVPEESRHGWNGKTTMVKNGLLDVGLLLGARPELEKLGYKVKIKSWKDKPFIDLKKGYIDPSEQYEYQNRCVTAILGSIPNGGGLVLSATGTGKTKIAAQLSTWIDGGLLFVVDQVDLMYQSKKEIEDWFKIFGVKQKVGIVGAGEFDPQKVTVATVQTLSKCKRPEYKKWTKTVKLIIIDEIHTQMAFRNFKVVMDIKPQAVIGLTATMQLSKKPVRMKCWSICGPQVFEMPIQEGVKLGVLTQGVVLQIPVAMNTEPRRDIKRKKKDKRTGKVKRSVEEANDYEHQVVFNPHLEDQIYALVNEALKQDYATVVLVERVRHLRRLARRLQIHEPELCYGAIKIVDRKKTIKHFDKGRYHLVIANRVFTKGVNIKRVGLIIDGAQRKNRNDCIQKFGRGVRLYDGKKGLLYFGLYTQDKSGIKAEASQRGAFKKNKIPVRTLSFRDLAFGPKGTFSVAKKFLEEKLAENKKGKK